MSWHIAWIYSGLGQKNEAFKWFEQAYEERHPLLPSIRAFPPGLDDLRMDQRFEDLVQRLKFPND